MQSHHGTPLVPRNGRGRLRQAGLFQNEGQSAHAELTGGTGQGSRLGSLARDSRLEAVQGLGDQVGTLLHRKALGVQHQVI